MKSPLLSNLRAGALAAAALEVTDYFAALLCKSHQCPSGWVCSTRRSRLPILISSRSRLPLQGCTALVPDTRRLRRASFSSHSRRRPRLFGQACSRRHLHLLVSLPCHSSLREGCTLSVVASGTLRTRPASFSSRSRHRSRRCCSPCSICQICQPPHFSCHSTPHFQDCKLLKGFRFAGEGANILHLRRSSSFSRNRHRPHRGGQPCNRCR